MARYVLTLLLDEGETAERFRLTEPPPLPPESRYPIDALHTAELVVRTDRLHPNRLDVIKSRYTDHGRYERVDVLPETLHPPKEPSMRRHNPALVLATFALLLGGCHFCADEANAIVMCVPFLGFAVAWLRTRPSIWRRRHSPGICIHPKGHTHGTSPARAGKGIIA
jgi:hypothetical protein